MSPKTQQKLIRKVIREAEEDGRRVRPHWSQVQVSVHDPAVRKRQTWRKLLLSNENTDEHLDAPQNLWNNVLMKHQRNFLEGVHLWMSGLKKNMRTTVRHGGGSVMVCGWNSHKFCTPESRNRTTYTVSGLERTQVQEPSREESPPLIRANNLEVLFLMIVNSRSW